jgi:hypothetical protein
MPKLTTTTANDTCFLCGKQAQWISFNSKQLRCTEKITQCSGFVKKAQNARDSNTTPEQRKEHMKYMSKQGNKRLAELHKDEGWRRTKGNNVSNAKTSIPTDQKSNWIIYEGIVDRITRESWVYHNDKINPDNLPRGREYELDHKYSKHQGFLNNIPPDVIGHYSNLQMIPRYKNRKKYNKCSITIDQLYEGIK